MTNGVLLFATNNESIDYIKQAEYCADRVKKYMNVPVALVTNIDVTSDKFDHVIKIETSTQRNLRRFYDGTLTHKQLSFKNLDRSIAYDVTPFDQTIVMDTDYIISNNILCNAYDSAHDFMIYKNAVDLCEWRHLDEFDYVNTTGIDFYWATVFYFKKTKTNKCLFNLITHIKENYEYYRSLYQITSPLYRNDFSFSIAIHMLNGFSNRDFAVEMPGKMYYTIDRDECIDIKENKINVLVQKQNRLGEYNAVSVNGLNVHIMNKFSLERIING